MAGVGRRAVAGRVAGRHARLDLLVGVGRQVAARYARAPCLVGLDAGREALAVDAQADRVAGLDFAADRPAQGDVAARFVGVENVVRRHVVDRQAGRQGRAARPASRRGRVGNVVCSIIVVPARCKLIAERIDVFRYAQQTNERGRDVIGGAPMRLVRAASVRRKFEAQRIDAFRHARQANERRAAARAAARACRRLFEQVIETAAVLNGPDDCVDAVAARQQGGIRRIGPCTGGHFVVESQALVSTHLDSSPVLGSQLDARIRPGQQYFAIVDRVAEMQRSQFAFFVFGESLALNKGNAGDGRGAGHDQSLEEFLKGNNVYEHLSGEWGRRLLY